MHQCCTGPENKMARIHGYLVSRLPASLWQGCNWVRRMQSVGSRQLDSISAMK